MCVQLVVLGLQALQVPRGARQCSAVDGLAVPLAPTPASAARVISLRTEQDKDEDEENLWPWLYEFKSTVGPLGKWVRREDAVKVEKLKIRLARSSEEAEAARKRAEATRLQAAERAKMEEALARREAEEAQLRADLEEAEKELAERIARERAEADRKAAEAAAEIAAARAEAAAEKAAAKAEAAEKAAAERAAAKAAAKAAAEAAAEAAAVATKAVASRASTTVASLLSGALSLIGRASRKAIAFGKQRRAILVPLVVIASMVALAWRLQLHLLVPVAVSVRVQPIS
eukprot:Transcript_9675.p1 GENE.Transcript_9675~~Transcript_9675.p1  ORF type:complete len:288 (-),score=60.79 Transcript_9675:142-1005(-)